MTVTSENSMLKHTNVDLNTVSLKASDCTTTKNKNPMLSNLHFYIFFISENSYVIIWHNSKLKLKISVKSLEMF
jgi:hypothetical protein